VQSVQSSLLAPIRSALGKWNSGEFSLLTREELWYSQTHVAYLAEALPLAALQISLERVEGALKAPT
jgi:hypothetical protein